MSLRSYAKILGIVPNEAGLIYKKDIRIAYLQLAKQFHPDKTQQQTDAATDQFVEIKAAYDKLMTACGYNDFIYIGDGTTFDLEALVGLLQSLAAKMKTHLDKSTNLRPTAPKPASNPKTPQQSTPTSSSTTDIKLRVTIHELYIGAWKKIKYKYLAGGELLSDEIYICLESYEDEYIFEGKGDEINGKRIDLKVIIDIAPDDVLYVDTMLTKCDICMTFTISLYDYYCRDSFIIEYFGELVEIKYTPGLSLQTIPNKGLPIFKDDVKTRGDLVVFFKLVLPHTIPNDIKPMLEKHFAGASTTQKSEEGLQTT